MHKLKKCTKVILILFLITAISFCIFPASADDNETANQTTEQPTTEATTQQPTTSVSTVTLNQPSNGSTWTTYKTISYSASITGGTATLWAWDFNNDGTTDKTDTSGASSSSGTYTYSAAGTYSVKLTVTSTDSNVTQHANIPVTITEPELVALMELDIDEDTNTVSYESTTAGATSWSWDFGDGSSDSILKNGTHTYTKPDEYTVTLTAKSPAGKTATKTGTVDLNKVMAYFTVDKAGGSAPLTVKFTDKSSENPDTNDDIVKWVWDFDDGSAKTTVTKSSEADVSHTFTKEGDYDVTLTVTDEDDDTDSYEMLITVDNDVAPTAAFSLYSDDYDDEGKAPHTVRFIDKSKPSTETNSTIDEWYWQFINEDDKVVYYSYSQNPPSYTFEDAGKYTIKLTVTDKNEASDTEIKEDFIEVTLALSATFSASPASGYTPLTVSFTATDGSKNDYDIEEYHWTFGDGYTDKTTSRTTTHTYTTPGTYTVKLKVTDEEDNTYTYTKENCVTVNEYTTVTAATTQATPQPTVSSGSPATKSSGEQIFGLPGTEYVRDEMERFYGFYEEYLSFFAGIFGMK